MAPSSLTAVAWRAHWFSNDSAGHFVAQGGQRETGNR